jgi:hypothetical protein
MISIDMPEQYTLLKNQTTYKKILYRFKKIDPALGICILVAFLFTIMMIVLLVLNEIQFSK